MSIVNRLLYGHMVDMGGVPVRQPLPTQQVEQLDPFLLLHHHMGHVPEGSNVKDLGVGPHPHRGFSPVTFVFQGSVHHRDSRNNSSIVHAGGVQWMEAGRGIIHSERPSKELAEAGGPQEIIQLWINTPAAEKMDQPRYQAFQQEELVRINPDQGTGHLSLVSGSMNGKKGPVHSRQHILAVMGGFEPEAGHTFRLDQSVALLYILNGSVRIDGFGLVEGQNLVVFEEGTKSFHLEARESTHFLLVGGQPIHEPLETYGPFVMNNQTQIMEAMRDYQMGKMGFLVEEF